MSRKDKTSHRRSNWVLIADATNLMLKRHTLTRAFFVHSCAHPFSPPHMKYGEVITKTKSKHTKTIITIDHVGLAIGPTCSSYDDIGLHKPSLCNIFLESKKVALD